MNLCLLNIFLFIHFSETHFTFLLIEHGSLLVFSRLLCWFTLPFNIIPNLGQMLHFNKTTFPTVYLLLARDYSRYMEGLIITGHIASHVLLQEGTKY